MPQDLVLLMVQINQTLCSHSKIPTLFQQIYNKMYFTLMDL